SLRPPAPARFPRGTAPADAESRAPATCLPPATSISPSCFPPRQDPGDTALPPRPIARVARIQPSFVLWDLVEFPWSFYRVYRVGVGPSSRRCRSQIAPSRL